jgi:hypothetical protein
MPTVTTPFVTYPVLAGFQVNIAAGSLGTLAAGITFTVPSAGSYVIDSLVCSLYKFGSPTGNATSSIYAITGTPGSTAVPTGSALGVSGNLDVTTLTTSPTTQTFSYSGANRIALTNSTTYFITVDFGGGDSADYIIASGAGAVPGQNYAVDSAHSGWTALTNQMMAFSVVGAYNAASILGISTLTNAGSINF